MRYCRCAEIGFITAFTVRKRAEQVPGRLLELLGRVLGAVPLGA